MSYLGLLANEEGKLDIPIYLVLPSDFHLFVDHIPSFSFINSLLYPGLLANEEGVISAPEGSMITEDGSLVAADGTVLAPPGMEILH